MLSLECLVFHEPGHRYARVVRLSRKEAAFLVARRSSARTHDLVRAIARIPATDTVEDWRVSSSEAGRSAASHRTNSPRSSLTSLWHDPDHTEPEIARLTLAQETCP